MFTNKYWAQIGSILKADFAVIKNIEKKVKGGVAASRLYKKDSQYKLGKAIFVDAINIIIERVSEGHLVVIDKGEENVYFQVDYKKVNKLKGNPYNSMEELTRADYKIPYIYMYYYGDRIKIIPTKAITENMLKRMAEGYRFTRKIEE